MPKGDRGGRSEKGNRSERGSASTATSGSGGGSSSGSVRRDREGSANSRDRDRERDRVGGGSSREDRRLRNEGDPVSVSKTRVVAVKDGGSGGSSAKGQGDGPSGPTSSKSITGGSRLKPPPEPAKVREREKEKGEIEDKSPEEPSPAIVLNKKELYEASIEYENALAAKLEISENLAMGQDYCTELDCNLQEIMAMLENPPEDPDELEEKMEDGLMNISALRTVNRMMKLKLKAVKDQQLAVRNEVDADHLLLQNLLYEATHLQSLVAATQDYRGKDVTIDLIPVDQFYQKAPQNISKPDLTKSDAHLLRIARLEYEFVQRQKLTEDCNMLEKEKEKVQKNIDETQSRLDSVAPMLNSIRTATVPVQEFFGMGIMEKKEQNHIAQFLPSELNLLFIHSNGLKDAKGNKGDFFVHVRGNLQEAKELVISPEEVDDDSDSEKELDGEVETSRRRLMRKKSSVYFTPEEYKKKLVQKHPLWVEWIVHPKKESGKGNNAVFIQFFYLIKLKMVTVKSVVLEDASKVPVGELAASDALLEDLFPDDAGIDSPNPANAFLLQKGDVKGIAGFIFQIGRPYRWAQRLAGLDFPLFSSPDREHFEDIRPNKDVSSLNMEKVLRAVRTKLTNRNTLSMQLKCLESRNIQLQIPPDAKELFPPKTSTVCKSWEPQSYSTYMTFPFAQEHLKRGLVTDSFKIFKSMLERGRATVTALFAIPPNYPAEAPVVCVQLEKDGEKRNATNDSAIRDLEAEVNYWCVKEFSQWKDKLAGLQCARLAVCIDMILETDFAVGVTVGPSEFGREHLFIHAARGRNLRRPFQYCGSGGGYFAHRY